MDKTEVKGSIMNGIILIAILRFTTQMGGILEVWIIPLARW